MKKELIALALILALAGPATAQTACMSAEDTIFDRTMFNPRVAVSYLDKATSNSLIDQTVKAFPQPRPEGVESGIAFDNGKTVEVVYLIGGCAKIMVQFDKEMFVKFMLDGA